ncbi:MAG: hypothetical protein WD535_00190 [Thermaerobacterales bacterium]
MAEQVERFLLRILILCLLLLLVSQSLLGYDATRLFVSYVDRLEGVTYDPAAPALVRDTSGASFMSPAGEDVQTISIALINRPRAPHAFLIINGVAAAEFTDGQIAVEVRPGDRLEIDGGNVAEELIFRVIDTSPGISEPRDGTELTVTSARVSLGVVR